MGDLIIDKESYKLSEKNYINEVTVKKKIVIGNTFSTDMRHCIGWNKRWNGRYTKTAMFTIDIEGNIHQIPKMTCTVPWVRRVTATCVGNNLSIAAIN